MTPLESQGRGLVKLWHARNYLEAVGDSQAAAVIQGLMTELIWKVIGRMP